MENIDVIDLTGVDTDNEGEEETAGGSNTISKIVKFTFTKQTRSSRLQLVRPWMSEVIYPSCYSESSKRRYNDLLHKSVKQTYVGESGNPFVGNGLFSAEALEPGEFICIYIGRHMPKKESVARINGGQNNEYMLSLSKDVTVDGYGVGQGAAMANHSCSPNARLEEEEMPGPDRAPVGILRALKKIEVGDEILTNYGYWNPVTDRIPDFSNFEEYVPCKCLANNCCGVLRLKE